MPRSLRVLVTLAAAAVAVVGLRIPAEAAVPVPTVADLGSWIDAYTAWDSSEGTTCSTTVQPGVTATISLLRRTYPDQTSYGTLRSCSSTSTSGHEEGRSLDWMLKASDPAQKAVADAFLGWLLATDAHGNRHAMARRFGIMYIIWNGRMWRAYDSDATKPWRTYTGSSPHTDHIHLSYGWDGARARTSYYIGGGCLPSTPGCPVTRLAGADRYATAVAIGAATRPSARTVVLASGEAGHLVDGLVGAPLAAAMDAPLLLTRLDSLPAATLAELRRRQATEVVVLGGPAAVSEAVVTAVAAEGISVRRLAGADRYETAAAIGREVFRLSGVVSHVFLAPAWDKQQSTALLLGGVAAKARVPILLTGGDVVPASTAAVLSDAGFQSAFVVSSVSPFSDGFVGSVPRAQRIFAADPAALSATIAQRFAPTATTAMVASSASTNVVDALPGGAAGHPVLLSAPTALSGPVATWLSGSSVASARALGGPAAVPDVVARQVALHLG